MAAGEPCAGEGWLGDALPEVALVGVLLALLSRSFFSCSFSARRAASWRRAREGAMLSGGGIDGAWLLLLEIEVGSCEKLGSGGGNAFFAEDSWLVSEVMLRLGRREPEVEVEVALLFE